MKHLKLIVLMVFGVFLLSACSNNKKPDEIDELMESYYSHKSESYSDQQQSDSKSEQISSDLQQSDPKSEEKESIQTSDESEVQIEDGIAFEYVGSVKNDVTGKWRLSKVYTDSSPLDYVVDYYNNYFKSDNEIHAIINYTTNTTIRVRVSLGMLDVTELEHIDGEENDAKELFSGDVINSCLISIKSGEVVNFDE